MSPFINGNLYSFKEAEGSELLFGLVFVVFVTSSIRQEFQQKFDIDKKDNV